MHLLTILVSPVIDPEGTTSCVLEEIINPASCKSAQFLGMVHSRKKLLTHYGKCFLHYMKKGIQ